MEKKWVPHPVIPNIMFLSHISMIYFVDSILVK